MIDPHYPKPCDVHPTSAFVCVGRKLVRGKFVAEEIVTLIENPLLRRTPFQRFADAIRPTIAAFGNLAWATDQVGRAFEDFRASLNRSKS